MTHRIYCDFDGTIAHADVTDMLLDAFADPGWREIEDQWRAGLIGSATCMARQVALMRCTREALDTLLDGISIDAAFRDFVTFCHDIGASLTVVSDGLHYVIERILARAQISGVPIVANKLIFLNEGRCAMVSPYSSPNCRSAAGTCKCAAARDENPSGLTVLIGDGQSDFCVAKEVDYVLAKDALLEFCRSESIPHESFSDFSELPGLLTAQITKTSRCAAKEGGIPQCAER